MKKLFAISICTLVFTSLLTAQVRFNPKVGWHNYHVAEEAAIDLDGQGGFTVGADVRFGSATYLQPGVYFQTFSADGKAVIEQGGQTLLRDELQFSMLRVPVVLGTSFLEIERFAMRVHIGGVANIPLSVESNVFALEDTNWEDVSFAATVGFGLDMGPVTFGIDYDLGITNTWLGTTTPQNNVSLDAGGKSRMLIFTFGILLGGY